MCGILGSFNKTINSDALSLLNHRGPDKSDYFKDEEIYLGHTRLSIQDLSDNGNQPMISDDGNLVLIYNGELYNKYELKKEIEEQNTRFRGSSDTEVLLRLYELYGENFLEKLNGIFALAIWNKKEKTLLVVRDHFGVKPLYFTNKINKFSFSSEIKAILALNEKELKSNIDYTTLISHLTYMWSPTPNTMFKDIKKLEPGTAIIVKNCEIIKKWKYYELNFSEINNNLSDEEAIIHTRDLIGEAVNKQLVSDVKVGAFLSGGLDSSAIVAFAKNIFPKNSFETFTIDFQESDPSLDGSPVDLNYAKKVAEHLNVNLNILNVNPMMIKDIRDMIYFLDEPQSDPAAINTMLISKFARESGIKVLLSGAGGDDIFAGYRRHFALANEKYWKWLPQNIKLKISKNIPNLSQNNSFMRRIVKLGQYMHLSNEERLASYFYWINPDILNSVIHENVKGEIFNFNVSSQLTKSLREIEDTTDDLNKLLYLEIKHFLSDHNLNYTDKMGMSSGVEIRVPLLDKELVEFSSTLPIKMKHNGFTGKWIFKKAMEGILPNDIIYRKKTGFGVPLRKWMKTNLKEYVNDVLSSQSLKNRMMFDNNGLQNLRELDQKNKIDASYTLFAIVCMETWFQIFVDNS